MSKANTSIKCHHEVRLKSSQTDGWAGGWVLCFQWCTFNFANSEPLDGYRFIWRKPNGKLYPALGQARLPTAQNIMELLRLASEGGWLGLVEKNGKPKT
jgi:hypothetical protein